MSGGPTVPVPVRSTRRAVTVLAATGAVIMLADVLTKYLVVARLTGHPPVRLLGGAMGNLGDRLFRAPGFLVGHVVDFISVFSPDGHYFAIFNVADSALCCGVALAILLEITGRRRDGTRLAKSDRG